MPGKEKSTKKTISETSDEDRSELPSGLDDLAVKLRRHFEAARVEMELFEHRVRFLDPALQARIGFTASGEAASADEKPPARGPRSYFGEPEMRRVDRALRSLWVRLLEGLYDPAVRDLVDDRVSQGMADVLSTLVDLWSFRELAERYAIGTGSEADFRLPLPGGRRRGGA